MTSLPPANAPQDDRRAAFAALMREPNERLPLDHAAALLARGLAYPDLDPATVVAAFDRLAAPLGERLAAGPADPASRDPLAVVETLNAYLAGERGFRGAGTGPAEDEADYYDPRNSLINDVLARRVGIPITLSLVYIEVARRVDFPLVGVGFPLHFLVKHPRGGAVEDDLYLDPFHGGAIVDPARLGEQLEAQTGGRIAFAEHYLAAVTKKQLLTRLLYNLKGIYLRRNDARRTREVVEYLLLIAPWDLEQRRDRGLLSFQLGDSVQALEDLQTYERFATDDPNLPVIRGYIEALRRRFALGG
ncbi:MAG: transglutaminase-like domain-containing protein [Chloroflexota bacterium]|nr:transglutaminase-like domain-containing protein [Chloroflexota bacterium]